MTTRKMIIVGSGPAGHTAALYAARADLAPLIIEGQEPGGQLTTTTDVENYPGFPEGIQGPEMMEVFKKQATRFGAQYESGFVKDVDLTQRPFKVTCHNGENYHSETLVLSTGASAKYLGLKNEKELIGKGVSACATCDAFFYRDKIVHVVGGGDTAMEEATFLTKFAKKVTIIHRRGELRASKTMQKRAFDNPKIDFLWNSEVSEILFDENGVNGLIVKNRQDQSTQERQTDGFFLGIGHKPNTDFLKGKVDLDDHCFVITKAPHPDTNVPGVFACGDVQDSYYRQAVTAAGSGCEAAIRA